MPLVRHGPSLARAAARRSSISVTVFRTRLQRLSASHFCLKELTSRRLTYSQRTISEGSLARPIRFSLPPHGLLHGWLKLRNINSNDGALAQATLDFQAEIGAIENAQPFAHIA